MRWKNRHILIKIGLIVGVIIGFIFLMNIATSIVHFKIEIPRGDAFKLICAGLGANSSDQYEIPGEDYSTGRLLNECYPNEINQLRIICGDCVSFANLNYAKKNPKSGRMQECINSCQCHLNDKKNWHPFCSSSGLNF